MQFEDVVKTHSARLYRLAYLYLRDGPAAEDAVQEAFLLYFRESGRVGNPGAWLNRVACNVCLNELRKRKRESPTDMEELPDSLAAGGFGDDLIKVPAALSMSEALLRLPLAYREVLVWHYYLDVPAGELAARLDLTPYDP